MQNTSSLPEQIALDDTLASIAIEEEDLGQAPADDLPWDPSKIRITTRYFSLREVVQQIESKEIDLSPDFQRDYVWKQRQRTKLIESILLGIPLPAFYFNQEDDGRYQVVDGVQRLSTVSLFMANGHILDKVDLEYLKHLHGATFSSLEPPDFRRIQSTQIVVHVIEPQTPDEVKYDIFGRVNTLGEPLSTQEIRHAMSKTRSRNFLKDLSELHVFDTATGWSYWGQDPDGKRVRNTARMANRELVLRFCALRRYSDEEYRRHNGLNSFLVDYTKRLDGFSAKGPKITDEDLHGLRLDFEQAMNNAHLILEKQAFRRLSAKAKRRSPISRAVFESQAVAFADYRLSELLPKADNIREAFWNAFEDPEYVRSVTVGTGDPRAVQVRIERTRSILAEALK